MGRIRVTCERSRFTTLWSGKSTVCVLRCQLRLPVTQRPRTKLEICQPWPIPNETLCVSIEPFQKSFRKLHFSPVEKIQWESWSFKQSAEGLHGKSFNTVFFCYILPGLVRHPWSFLRPSRPVLVAVDLFWEYSELDRWDRSRVQRICWCVIHQKPWTSQKSRPWQVRRGPKQTFPRSEWVEVGAYLATQSRWVPGVRPDETVQAGGRILERIIRGPLAAQQENGNAEGQRVNGQVWCRCITAKHALQEDQRRQTGKPTVSGITVEDQQPPLWASVSPLSVGYLRVDPVANDGPDLRTMYTCSVQTSFSTWNASIRDHSWSMWTQGGGGVGVLGFCLPPLSLGHPPPPPL